MTFLNALTLIDFAYTIVGLVFVLGAGGVLFAFALSFISQKLAMWMDVRKIVLQRNGLLVEVKNLQTRIDMVEGLIQDEVEDETIAPTDIGVRVVDPNK